MTPAECRVTPAADAAYRAEIAAADAALARTAAADRAAAWIVYGAALVAARRTHRHARRHARRAPREPREPRRRPPPAE